MNVTAAVKAMPVLTCDILTDGFTIAPATQPRRATSAS